MKKESQMNTKEKIDPFNYSTKNLPFLLNYEYFNIAWGDEHEGYFIDTLGNILNYTLPAKWNFYISSEKPTQNIFWGNEIDGQISPKHLFENLNSLKKEKSDVNIITIRIEEIVHSLTESGYEHSFGACDMGIHSYSILIFDNTIDQYKRIVLKTVGNECITNKSPHSAELLKFFNNIKPVRDKIGSPLIRIKWGE